jgi:hypothetical protein
MEQTDEWAEQRRYMGLEILAKARRRTRAENASHTKEVTQAITAYAPSDHAVALSSTTNADATCRAGQRCCISAPK